MWTKCLYSLRIQVCKPVPRVSCIPIDDHLWEEIKTKIATKTSDASSPHRLLTPSSCSQLNSGQTSRLVSCGVTFGSQYTHLIRPSSFFQRTPSARFSPSLLILALLDLSRFLWPLMMVPLSGFLIGLDVQHFVFMVLYVKCKLKD